MINRGDPTRPTRCAARSPCPRPPAGGSRPSPPTPPPARSSTSPSAAQDEQAQYNLGYTTASRTRRVGAVPGSRTSRPRRSASGDISGFGYTVSTADLRPGVTRKATIAPGLHERVYPSAYTVPATSGPPTESMSYVGVKGRGSGGAAPAFAPGASTCSVSTSPTACTCPGRAPARSTARRWSGTAATRASSRRSTSRACSSSSVRISAAC